VAHGVGPFVKQVQVVSVQSVLNGVLTEPHVEELRPSHHPVLPPGKPRDRLIPRVTTASPRGTVQ
jgi:hypothetical protein